MKKFYLLLTMAILIVSCQKETTSNHADVERDIQSAQTTQTLEPTIPNTNFTIEDEAFKDLHAELEELSLLYPTEVNSRGRVWRWFTCVIGGDIIGAAIGACLGNPVLGAILGSLKGAGIAAGLNVNDRYIPKPQTPNPNMNIMSIAGNAQYAGYLHNLIIYDVYTTLGPNFENYSDAELENCIATWAFTRMRKSVSATQAFYANSSYKTLLNYSLNNYNTLSSEQLFRNISATYPSRANEIESICIFGEQYAGYINQATKDNYTESFVSTVQNSSISHDAKNFIISVVKVANHSDNMWELATNN